MPPVPRQILLALLAAALSSSCEVKKSANPLTPTVAGPIPGVHISTPKMVDPTSGAKITVDRQPITLTIENATSNGPRPLTYLFEVASDAAFSSIVFSRDGVAPGDGRTSVKLSGALGTGRTYYWRARAQDGANTGAYANSASFDIVTPVVIGAPTLVAPAANATTGTLQPRFIVANAPRSGPAGKISYRLELSASTTFATKTVWTFAEASGQSSVDAPSALQPSTA